MYSEISNEIVKTQIIGKGTFIDTINVVQKADEKTTNCVIRELSRLNQRYEAEKSLLEPL